MLTFRNFVAETKETAPVIKPWVDVKNAIGETRAKALLKHPWFTKHAPPEMDRTFRHCINSLGDHEVEVYPHDVTHRVDNKIRPTKFVRFQFYKHRVANAHLFTRGKDSDMWTWKESLKED